MVASTHYPISVGDLRLTIYPYLSSWGSCCNYYVLKGNTAFARDPQLIRTRPSLITQYFPSAAEAPSLKTRAGNQSWAAASPVHPTCSLPSHQVPALANQR